jgi:antibiotic biosynthesis monooxygenase (ABM) superfamily enzyme
MGPHEGGKAMITSNRSLNEPATAVFSWTVKPSKEKLFEERMHEIHRVARTYPGHMGVTTIKSPGRDNSFQTVLRFDTKSHLDAWLRSPIRHQLTQALEETAHNDSTKKASGLETWFEIPGQLVMPPPRWKMVISTFIAIYPISLAYGLFLAPHVESWPVWIRSLFLPIFAPIILTYLFMPYLTQVVLKRWLYKERPGSKRTQS